MKTTVELPDQLYRRVKALAALKGQSIKVFLSEALAEKLAQESARPKRKTGWRAAFGTAAEKDVTAIQRLIDEEFSNVDPEDWQ